MICMIQTIIIFVLHYYIYNIIMLDDFDNTRYITKFNDKLCLSRFSISVWVGNLKSIILSLEPWRRSSLLPKKCNSVWGQPTRSRLTSVWWYHIKLLTLKGQWVFNPLCKQGIGRMYYYSYFNWLSQLNPCEHYYNPIIVLIEHDIKIVIDGHGYFCPIKDWRVDMQLIGSSQLQIGTFHF